MDGKRLWLTPPCGRADALLPSISSKPDSGRRGTCAPRARYSAGLRLWPPWALRRPLFSHLHLELNIPQGVIPHACFVYEGGVSPGGAGVGRRHFTHRIAFAGGLFGCMTFFFSLMLAQLVSDMRPPTTNPACQMWECDRG